MKWLAIYWLGTFGAFVIWLTLFGETEISTGNLQFGAIISTVLGPLLWLRYQWAPKFYRRRKLRKVKKLDAEL